MKKVQFLILCLMLCVTLVPALVLAQEGESSNLIPCGHSDEEGNLIDTCDFKGLMALVDNVINFLVLKLALPIAAVMFAYAGISLILASGGEGKTKAKNIFTNTVIGLVIAAAAYLVIKLILFTLGYDGAWIGF